MKKRYAFLIFSVLVGITIVYFGRTDETNPEIDELENEIGIIKQEGDSTLDYAEDIVDDFVEQKKVTSEKIESFKDLVEDQNGTIDEQIKELRKLLKEANDFKKLAEDNAERARLMEEMANKQKEMAEMARMEANKQLHEAMNANQKLRMEIERLNKLLTSKTKATMSYPPPPSEGKKDKKKKMNK